MSEPDIPSTSITAPRAFGARLLGALKLDASVYEEVEHDPGAMGQAAGVIALGAIASALAGVGSGAPGVLLAIPAAFVGWVISAGVVWLIGVRMMGHSSDFQELLRTLGFASAPQVLAVLAIVPMVGGLVLLAVAVLMVIAFVIAVRQALDVSTGRAVLVCVLAVVAQVLLRVALASLGFSA